MIDVLKLKYSTTFTNTVWVTYTIKNLHSLEPRKTINTSKTNTKQYGSYENSGLIQGQWDWIRHANLVKAFSSYKQAPWPMRRHLRFYTAFGNYSRSHQCGFSTIYWQIVKKQKWLCRMKH